MSLNCPVSSDLLRCVDASHLLNLLRIAVLHHCLCHDELLQDLLFGVLSPSEPRFTKIAILKAKEELFSCRNRPIIQVFLSGSSANALEDLFTKGLPCDGANGHHSILSLFNAGCPLEEDVLKLGNVDVARFSVLESGKRGLEVLLDLVTVLRGRVQRLGQGLNLSSLLSTGLVTLMRQVTPRINCLLVLAV